MSAAALAFAAAALGLTGLALVAAEVMTLRRRRDASPWPRASAVASAMAALAALGRRLAPAARLAVPSDLESRIAAAGLASAPGPLRRLDARELMAGKLIAAALGGALGLVSGSAAPGRLGLALSLVGPLAGFLLPDLWLARLARERARRMRRELPGMLDLLRVAVDAGLPLTAALAAVGERARGVLAAEWRTVGREVALGVPLTDSLGELGARAPTGEITTLIAALDRATRHGAPLSETLAAQARDARAARSRRIREEAARAGPKIQLVVALLLVPSVLLLVAAALATALLDHGGGLALL